MSKGLGKRQRAILATLADHEAFWLRSMLGPSCTKAEYNALRRAALKLEAAGLVKLQAWAYGLHDGTGRLAVCRIGTPIPDRQKVVKLHRGELANTYPAEVIREEVIPEGRKEGMTA